MPCRQKREKLELELCIREAGETRPVVIRVASAKVAVEVAATATVPTVRVGAGQQLPCSGSPDRESLTTMRWQEEVPIRRVNLAIAGP